MGGLRRACLGLGLPAVFALLVPAARLLPADAGQVPAARPNILFILTDDLDAATMDHFPVLRALLSDQGATFANYFDSLSLCCPSRTTILRGQYAHNTAITGNRPPAGGFEKVHALGLETSTIATWLRAAGYHTALLGKYLNGYPRGVAPTYVPPGWSDWYSPAAGNAYGEFNYTLNENGTLVPYGNRPEDYMVDVLAARAQAIMRRTAQDGTPFFIEIATYAPHGPATPAPRHADAFPDAQAPRTPSFNEEDVSDKPAWLRARPPLTPRQIEQIDALYRRRLQSLLAVQDLVAGLIDTLRATGQLANTYIFLSSDNGFHLGQHRLPSGKQTAYEEDIRVPLLVRGPGIAAGRVIDQLAGNVDLAPTFAELAGVQPPDFVDGRSLVPLLHGDTTAAASWRGAFLIEHGDVDDDKVSLWKGEVEGDKEAAAPPHRQGGRAAGRGRPAAGAGGLLEPPDPMERAQRVRGGAGIPTFQALRTADVLYVRYVTGEQELYDLRADPAQLQNLAGSADPELLARLAAWLAVLGRCAGAGCRTADVAPPARIGAGP
jgi:N-acetylglucosamine-6-sulfatase